MSWIFLKDSGILFHSPAFLLTPCRYSVYRGKALVVFGHTPVPEPDRLNNTITIDPNMASDTPTLLMLLAHEVGHAMRQAPPAVSMDKLTKQRGGCAANISYTLALLATGQGQAIPAGSCYGTMFVDDAGLARVRR